MRRCLWILFFMVGVVACETPEALPPTITRVPSLAPSSTVLPFVLPESTEIAIGRSNPTEAALAAEGEPSAEPQISPQPTQATIPLTILTMDNRRLPAVLFGAPQRPAPAILLVQGVTSDFSDLRAFASFLQNNGYHVLLLELQTDNEQDISAAIQTLQTLPIVSTLGIFAEGASVGLAACQMENICRGVMLTQAPPNSGAFTKPMWVASQWSDWDTFLATGFADLLAWLANNLN